MVIRWFFLYAEFYYHVYGRETIRRAIVQKFNEVKGWNCQTLDDLYERIEDKREANVIINSLKICDPAAGSGHFLVSALNEIIAIKSELRVLLDSSGKSLKDYRVEVRKISYWFTMMKEIYLLIIPIIKKSNGYSKPYFTRNRRLSKGVYLGWILTLIR